MINEQPELSLAPSSGVRPSQRTARPTIIIIGHGMVGQRVAEEVRMRRALDGHRVVIFGEEQARAYDRVHLCNVLRGGSAEELSLVGSEWYAEHQVEVQSGQRVVEIDRDNQCIVVADGQVEHYDHLVLATGGQPVIGKFEGNDGRDVFTLRTLQDAANIRARALTLKEQGLPAVVVGGGLLGLELADELGQLGVRTIVLESADFPLSRQLEKSAGTLLAEMLKRPNLELRFRCRVARFVQVEESTLVELEGQDPIECGMVVLAMGIRARDYLARLAGLRCDLFGGVEVNDQLLSSDPKISAVGECARHAGMTYGLVAPGYAMAEVVAKRLAGAQGAFRGVQVGTRLKARGIELTVVGQSGVSGLGTKSLEYYHDGKYRRLSLRKNRVIGIVAVGKWPELPRAQEAMARAEKLKPVQLRRFEENEAMWGESKLSLKMWPDAATVCTCMGVTCGALRRAQQEGCANVEALAERTGASTVCGSCKPLLATLTDDQAAEPEPASTWMSALSWASVLGALLFVCLPAIPYAESVQKDGIDVLFRTTSYKQITGFSVAGLFALSIVFSMRKRLSWLRWGDFEAWRIAHAALGLLCLVGGFLHTGLRLGSQLDFALACVFLGSVLLGGVAGGWDSLQQRLAPERARQLRGWLIRSHIYLLWPLPLLLGFHVLKVYFF